MLDLAHVRLMWSHHSFEVYRMPLKPILVYLGPMPEVYRCELSQCVSMYPSLLNEAFRRTQPIPWDHSTVNLQLRFIVSWHLNSHPKPTINSKQLELSFIEPGQTLPDNHSPNIWRHKPRRRAVFRAVVLTGAPWWLFFSYSMYCGNQRTLNWHAA